MEEVEKVEKKVNFELEEKEMLINFFNSNPSLWKHHFTEYRDRNLRDALYEKLVELFDGKFLKEDIKREWHNLQTIYKREKAREEGSRVSGSGSCNVYVSTWELFSQMEFIDVTGDVDTSYTSLEGYSQPPKRIKTQTKATEDAKTELWKALAASLKPQAAPQQQSTANNELSERANLFGKVFADSLLQYEPGDWSHLKKKVMDVFYDFEQQKSANCSNHQNALNAPYNPRQLLGNQFQPGPFMNMLTNASSSTSQNTQFDLFSPSPASSDAS